MNGDHPVLQGVGGSGETGRLLMQPASLGLGDPGLFGVESRRMEQDEEDALPGPLKRL
jgi:hypothetical protein